MVSASNPVELVEKALQKFKQKPEPVTVDYGENGFQLNVIQELSLVKDPKKQDQEPPEGKFFAYVWTTDAEMKALKAKLADFAKVGLVIAVSKPVYAQMKIQDIRRARMAVKEFTRHNDKLGFDYSIPMNGYYASYSVQFAESAYGGKKEDKFLQSAIKFYTDHSLPATAAHFKKMNEKYTMQASEGAKATFSVPEAIDEERRISGYIMEIEELNMRLRKNEDRLEAAERELRESWETIQGYHDSVVLTPHQVVDFPQQLRNNVRKVLEQMQTTDETRYAKSMLDPFHPDSLGVRVPSRVPRNTVTYNTHQEYSFKATNAVSDIMYITNFEQLSGYYYVALEGIAVQNFLTSPPGLLENCQVNGKLDDAHFDINYVPIGPRGSVVAQTLKDDTWHDNFYKLRCVAGGVRVLKTSKQESESGSLDMIYSRDGSSFDEGHSFKTDLARIRPDRVRTYLAGAGCCLRETNGFVIQTNKRPHDEASLDLLDIKKMNNSKGQNFAPLGLTSPVWFVDVASKILYRPDELASIPGGTQVGLVLESLQQRHTSITIAQDLQDGMTLSFETIFHLEGIADQTAYGFTQASAAKLRSAATTLQLLDKLPVDRIFSPYHVRRPELLELILQEGKIRGFWDETLFPTIKEMVRYGADSLAKSDFLDDIIDAVVDSAAGTLGYMAPQFLPAIMAASNEVKDPLHNLATDALKAASAWSKRVNGPHQPYRQIMIDTTQPKYGKSVLDEPN